MLKGLAEADAHPQPAGRVSCVPLGTNWRNDVMKHPVLRPIHITRLDDVARYERALGLIMCHLASTHLSS